MGFLPGPTARRNLNQPKQEHVDLRAACFCHRKIVDIGYVCSVCLSSESPAVGATGPGERGSVLTFFCFFFVLVPNCTHSLLFALTGLLYMSVRPTSYEPLSVDLVITSSTIKEILLHQHILKRGEERSH